jgi:hypothetical protein
MAVVSQAFVVVDDRVTTSSTTTTRLYNTGGWGIGPQRELTEAEFLKRGGDRGVFSGYELQSDFGRNIEAAASELRSQEMEELLGVAAMAGIDFDRDRRGLLDRFADDDEDLRLSEDIDVSVDWDDQADDGASGDWLDADGNDVVRAESITRLDEDTGALGVW